MATAQVPLCTTALYWVVTVRFEYVNVVVVLLIVVQVLPFVEDSQRITDPVCPESVTVPIVVPEHKVVEPLTVPPTELSVTDTCTAVEVLLQPPDVTTLLNQVVCVNTPGA
jgi:hypothetical protein